MSERSDSCGKNPSDVASFDELCFEIKNIFANKKLSSKQTEREKVYFETQENMVAEK